MDTSLPLAAGAVATFVFAASALPMLGKALRTRDLTSYSRSNLVLANVGNLVYSLYVFSLPPGPIWALHTFYVVSSGLMLGWSLRYAPTTDSDETPRSGSCTPNTEHQTPATPRPAATPRLTAASTSRP